MTQLDEDALSGLKTASRERKLTTAERIAVYAFHMKGVPPKLIARTFGVKTNAIYYITNWEHTAAYQNAKTAYEHMGEARVWDEIILPTQIASINDGMQKLLKGKYLDDSGYRGNPRSRPRARRTRTTSKLPEAANDGADGGGGAA